MNNMFQLFQAFRQNPMQMLSRRYNIPQGIANDPNAILQHLLTTGQVSQNQVNAAMGMRNDPMVQQMMQNTNQRY